MSEDFPDVEEGMRQYLRADADVQARVAQRVFFGIPRAGAEFPLITLSRAGGGEQPGEAPVDQALINISCWGGASKQEAWNAAAAVRKALFKIRARTLLAPGVYAFGAQVDGVIWSPDPADDRPRYTLTVEVTGISS